MLVRCLLMAGTPHPTPSAATLSDSGSRNSEQELYADWVEMMKGKSLNEIRELLGG